MTRYRLSGLVAAALLAADLFGTTTVTCSAPSPRELAGGARLIAFATPTAQAVWRIDLVVHGVAPASGELHTDISMVGGCIGVEVGKSYLLCERCTEEDMCQLSARPMEDTAGDLEFLHARHVEDWTSVMNETKRWIDGLTSTPRFNDWVRTADTDESDRYSGTILLVRYLETMTADFEQMEQLASEIAGRLRSGAVNRGIRDLDSRWCSAPSYGEVDRALSAITSGREWRNVLDEIFGAPEASR